MSCLNIWHPAKEKIEEDFSNWFNSESAIAGKIIRAWAIRDGIEPEELSYGVETMQEHWDLRIIITAEKGGEMQAPSPTILEKRLRAKGWTWEWNYLGVDLWRKRDWVCRVSKDVPVFKREGK